MTSSIGSEKVRSREIWDCVGVESKLENYFGSLSLGKKLFTGLVLFGLILFAPICLGSELAEKAGTAEYESYFRLLAQAPVAFVTPIYFLMYVKMFWTFQQLETSLQETCKFALRYSPEMAAWKYKRARRHVRLILLSLVLSYYPTTFAWFAAPIVQYLTMYPQVDYNQLYLFFGDQDFGYDRINYFWYIHGVSFCCGLALTTIVLLSHFMPLMHCTLIGGQIETLTSSLKAIDRLQEKETSHGTESTHLDTIESTEKEKEPVEGPHSFTKLATGRESSSFLKNFPSSKNPTRSKYSIENNEAYPLLEKNITLRNCIIHHQQILRLMCQVKRLLTPFLFFKVLCSMVTIANIPVIITSAGTHLSKFLVSVTFMVLFTNLTASIWCLHKLRDSLLDLSWNYFTVAEAMAKKHPENVVASN